MAMRLTIARKIALAVIGIVVVSIGTMAWVTSSNLQRGFTAYLNEMQAQDLDNVAGLIATRYKAEGSFDWLRRQPRAMREVLDQMRPQISAADEGERRRRPPPRRDGPPEGQGDGPPEMAPPPPGARDPMGFASRLSIVDADGFPVVGPREIPLGSFERKIVVDGTPVGTIHLRPLRLATSGDKSATGFLREQLRDILILSAVLGGAAILVAVWLARHLLRPVAALREVTARLAQGQFDARAPVLSRDELAELAVHVNEMAQALQENERQRRRLIADISHELRTPLTVIRGELEALIDGIRAADGRALESLHAEVLRLNKLVDDLHQLTLGDAGDLKFDWQELNLDELLLPLLERFQPRAAEAGLTLTWAMPSQRLKLQGDGGRLTQVILNLLENSLRYTDRGGRIIATLKAGSSHAELTIEDSAPGVPASAFENIFVRVSRVDRARPRERGGSGLGLAICKMLIERLRQRLAARSEPGDLSQLLGQMRALLPPAAQERLTLIRAAVGSQVRMIPVGDVVFFEALDKYVNVVTVDGEALIRVTLRELLPQLDDKQFWQVHRGTIVNASCVASAARDEAGKVTLTLRNRAEKLRVSPLYAHLFRQM
jgi:two-component system sensor histidine kinase BaeS